MTYLRKYPITTLTILSIIGFVYLFWFYRVDGIYLNKPFTYSYDTQAIPLEKKEYRVGEMVRIKVAFCKNREATVKTIWSLVDGKIVFFPEREVSELPTGCFPREGGVATIDLFEIPRGEYKVGEKLHFEAVSTITISSDRERKQTYRTESFTIIP